ncbi:MAG TPA: hypothetical protein VFY17_03940, partial [Pilimelia sp.]|nr:hypothetical protein [Pilimelia sp.]
MTDTLAQLYQAFGVLVALLVAATAAARAVRLRRERRRERAAAAPRRRLLAFVAEPDDAGAAELVALSEAQWRAVAPVALPLLGKLRGDAYAALADVFIRRGAAHTARRALRARSAVTRATAAQLLGDLRHTDAVPDLVAALDDRSGEVAVVAVRAL